MIEKGDLFPDFHLPNESGEIISLNKFRGSKLVIYFYPKDDTPGCTVEACSFRDELPQFGTVNVIGISPDSAKSHQKFVSKFKLNFTLLADEKHELAEACGIWVEKSMYGKKYMGIERTTYLIDESGIVIHVWVKVKPQDHAKEVFSMI